jgi:hypothetical protein
VYGDGKELQIVESMTDPFIIHQGRPESNYFSFVHWKVSKEDKEPEVNKLS